MKDNKLKAFDYIKSINQKNYLEDLSGFSPYLTAMYYSAGNYLMCYIANALNKIGQHKMSKLEIYDYYFYSIPKNSKWITYPKKVHDPKQVKYIQEFFKCDEISAKTSLEIIDKKELKLINEFYEKRGFLR